MKVNRTVEAIVESTKLSANEKPMMLFFEQFGMRSHKLESVAEQTNQSVDDVRQIILALFDKNYLSITRRFDQNNNELPSEYTVTIKILREFENQKSLDEIDCTYTEASQALFRLVAKFQLSGLETALIGHFMGKIPSTNDGYIDLKEELFLLRASCLEAIGCTGKEYVTRLFRQLEKKNVLRAIKYPNDIIFRTLHPEFIDAIRNIVLLMREQKIKERELE